MQLIIKFRMLVYLSFVICLWHNELTKTVINHKQVNDTLHTVFTTDIDKKSGRSALSFKTKQHSDTIYLAPSSNRQKRIMTKMTEDPQYVFQTGEAYTEKQLLSFEIGWEIIAQNTE